MVGISDSLTWAIVKKHNSFLVTRGKTTFTNEPFNVVNVPRRSMSGLANGKAIGSVATPNGNVVLQFKTKSWGNKPAKAAEKVELRTFGRGPVAAKKTVVQLTRGARQYRSDLTRLAAARVTRQARAGYRKAAGVKYTPKSRSNK